MKKSSKKMLSIAGIIILSFICVWSYGYIEVHNPDKILSRSVMIYGGDFDYSSNDTIFFKDKSGWSEIVFEDNTKWSYGSHGKYGNSWYPYFQQDGYNFSMLNQSAKEVKIYINDYRTYDSWDSELSTVILYFDNNIVRIYDVDNLKSNSTTNGEDIGRMGISNP